MLLWLSTASASAKDVTAGLLAAVVSRIRRKYYLHRLALGNFQLAELAIGNFKTHQLPSIFSLLNNHMLKFFQHDCKTDNGI